MVRWEALNRSPQRNHWISTTRSLICKLIHVQGIRCDSSLLAASLELLQGTLSQRPLSPPLKLAPLYQASYCHLSTLQIADIPSRGASVTGTPTSTYSCASCPVLLSTIRGAVALCAEPDLVTPITVVVLELKRQNPNHQTTTLTKPSR